LILGERGIVQIIPIGAALEVEVVFRSRGRKKLERLLRELHVIGLHIGGVKSEHVEGLRLRVYKRGRERDDSRHEE
jgi:hypothetical protein